MHQDRYTRQKVPPLTENTQDDMMRTEQSGNFPVPSVFPQGNNHDQPNTFRQPSSRTQNGNPPPLSNEHNLPNSQFPNHSPECCRIQGSLPWQYPPGWSHHSSLSQNITSPSSPVNTNESFNDRGTYIAVNHYSCSHRPDRPTYGNQTRGDVRSNDEPREPTCPQPRERPPQQSSFHETATGSGSCQDLAIIPEEDPIYDDGTSTSRNPEKENEVDHATARGLSVQTPKSIPGNNLHCPPVLNRSLPSEQHPSAEGTSTHHSDDPSLTPQPRGTSVSAIAASLQSVVTELERPDGEQTSVGRFRHFLSKARKPVSNPNGGSLRSCPSWSSPISPIKSLFGGSKQSPTPFCSEILKRFPNGRVPILCGGKLTDIVNAYMNADLDPSYGSRPKFHPLWDPHITHYRSSGRSMNVYDVGHFDNAGRFVTLFNLCSSMEENERLLKFKFKTIHFVPLDAKPNDPYPLRNPDMNILDRNAIPADHSHPRAGVRDFILRKGLKSGAAIAVLGGLLHYSSHHEDTLSPIADVELFNEYFTTQSIEWYRHAINDRQRPVDNGELVLITDTYNAAGWGNFVFYTTKLTGADKNHSISFYQDPSDSSYRWKYDIHSCEAAVYQAKPSTGSEPPMDQCIGFRGYAIRCPAKAWLSM